jgi:hypothetical protein
MWGDDYVEDFEDELPIPPPLEVDIGGPEVLGELFGPDGEVMFTLVDRPILPFGFCR